MRLKLDKNLIIIAAVGSITTLLTGLITAKTLAGGTHYGLPIPWLIKIVLAPEHNPWRIRWTGLLFDTFFWGLIVFIFIKIFQKLTTYWK